MAIGSDFEIQSDGDIRHVSGSTNYTVLELHRWLQDLADQAAASGDDYMDITKTTPSERSTDNIITLNAPYNIDDTAAEYLYDGSITQTNPVTSKQDIYAGLVVVGAVESGTQVQITQDEVVLTSFWSTGINADAAANILSRMLVKVKADGHTIDGQRLIVWARELSDTYAEFSVTMALGNNVAALFTANDLNNQTLEATISGWSDVTNTEGYQLLDIAGDGSANEPYYSQWDQASRTKAQLYERTKWLARRGSSSTLHGVNGQLFRGITHEIPYDGQSSDFATNHIVVWGTSFAYDGGTGTVPAVGQYWENTTAGGVGKVVFVSSGAGATGTVVLQREAATPAWADNDVFALLGGTGSITAAATPTAPTSTSTGGAAIVLADNDAGVTGTLWLQLISGTILGNNDPIWRRGGTIGKYADANGSATARSVRPEFIGQFTGAAIIGAFGIGIDPNDGIAADLFTTLTGSNVSPPNNQVFTVFGLSIDTTGGKVVDRVLVCNNQSGAPDFDQFTLNTTLSGASETACVVTTSIPADTPQSGTIRIQTDLGIYRRVAYSSWSGSTFTFTASEDFSSDNATAPRNVFISYIDKAATVANETVTLKYQSDRTMFVRVRNGGPVAPIKTFEATAAFGSGGGSTSAIRTPDA